MNEPSAFSVSAAVGRAGPGDRGSGSPSGSVSLARTPGGRRRSGRRPRRGVGVVVGDRGVVDGAVTVIVTVAGLLAAVAVGGGVGEGVGAGEVGGGGVGEGAVGGRAVSVPLARAGDQGRGQRVAVGVGVVGQDAGGGRHGQGVSSATV